MSDQNNSIVVFYQKLVSQQQEMINFLVNQNSQFDRIIRLLQTIIKSQAGSRKQILEVKNLVNKIDFERSDDNFLSQIVADNLIDDNLIDDPQNIMPESQNISNITFHPDYNNSILENSNII